MFLKWRKKTPISRLVEGRMATVQGEIVASETLTLPITGTRCVFYDLLVEVYKKGPRGQGRPLWMPLNVERRCNGFYVDDGEGRVWVEGKPEAFFIKNCDHEAGEVPKHEFRRFSAWMLKDKRRIIVRGVVSKPEKGEPKDTLVLRADAGNIIEILMCKQN